MMDEMKKRFDAEQAIRKSTAEIIRMISQSVELINNNYIYKKK